MRRIQGLLIGAALLTQIEFAQTLTKSFSPNPVAVNGTTTVTLTLTNPLAASLSGIEFTDTLPLATFAFQAFLPTPATTCDVASYVNATGVLTVDQATLAAGASCTVAFTVQPLVTGNIINTTSNINVGRDILAGTAATAVLAVVNPPTISKVFGAGTIAAGGITTLTFTVGNPNATTLTTVNFTDTLPGGLVIAAPLGPLNVNCTIGSTLGVVTAALNSNSVALAASTLLGNGSCSFTVNVQANVAGTFVNTTGTVRDTATGGVGGTATATLVALAPPTLTKAFVPPAIVAGGVSTLTFNVSNPNVGTSVTGIAFSDTLPANVIVSSPNGLNVGTCAGAAITANAGTSIISLSGLTLAAGASCQFTVNVTGITVGTLTNTTSAITSTNASTGLTASAAIAVSSGEAFQVRYAANLNLADSVINIVNTGANGASPTGPAFGPVGNICVNIYAFSPDEQLIDCCSCLITPSGLASLSVSESLRSNTLTGVTPNSMVIKLVATGAGAGFAGTSCTGSAAAVGSIAFPIAQGVAAWGTSVHIPGAGIVPGAPAPFVVTETPFTPATLSLGEVASINNRCVSIMGNGSGFGICRSCGAGGRGGEKF